MQTDTMDGLGTRHVPAHTLVTPSMETAKLLAAAALVCLPSSVSAEPAAPPAGATSTLTVGGEGRVERSADLGRLAVTIVTDDDDAARSAGKNTDIYNALKARAAALGVVASAVRTTGFNVQFVPHPASGLPPEQRLPRYGYVTSRSLAIDVTPVENVGKVVDAATSAGVTDIGDVSFDLRDRKSAFREALAAAFADAKANAAALAAAGGVRILRVKTIASGGVSAQPVGLGVMLQKAAPTPTQIESNGPIAVSAHVDVVYDIR